MAVPEITINKLNRYEMPQLIQEAYQNVHNWFELDPEFKNYKRFSYDQDAQRVLRRDNFADAAYNFHIYFPTHYFKVCHALQSDRVIGVERLAAWLRYTPYLSVVDMGCGDGAASVAAISSVINLKREHRLDVRKIQLMCIGIDPNPHGLVIYKRMLEEVREASAPFGIDIKIQPLRSRLSEAAGSVENCLFDVRQAWKQPSLSHTVLIMSNLMDILYNEHNKDSDSLRRYEKFGLALDEPFGEPISAFVRNLFDGVPIDHLHMLSIDTEPKQIEDAVIKMVGSLHLRMEEKQHTFDHEQIRLEKIELINPAPSYWFRKKGSNSYRLDEFLIFAAHIHNHDLTADERWKLITSPENLELAWARARQEMLRESLVDEIEIRLFEQDLTENLHRLHFELENYAIHSGYLPQILHYGFPKNTEHDRPRGLTWLEEAILLVAIIQIIGIPQLRNNSQSYAYLLSPENSIERKATEYLYERWTTAWQRYRSDIEDYARKYPTGVVIKVDIKSYYTRILHDRLRLILREELQISRRIEWLIELLVSKEIKDHDPGRGLVQGSIGSGFLSNLYLSPFDNLFPRNDAKQRRLFRYVDDIVVVVPDPNDEEITKNSLDMVLADLALEANEDKTGTYTISDFLKLIERDPVLDDLNQRYETFMDSLWWLDNELRDQFSNSSSNEAWWWNNIGLYKACIAELDLYVSDSWLSREISKKIVTNVASEVLLDFPDLPLDGTYSATHEWAKQFQTQNSNWNDNVASLKNELVSLFQTSLKFLENANAQTLQHEKDIANRRLRFAANRIGILGLRDIHIQLTNLICETPWWIREHMRLLENLARQGYVEDIWSIIDHHTISSREMADYVSSIALRALRFVPRLEADGWSRLATYMFHEKEIIRLMASETWILLSARFESIPQADKVREQLYNTIASNPPPSRRLLKNYILILGKLDPVLLESMGFDEIVVDPLLSQAYKSGVSIQSDANLLLQVEPEIIRQKYYSAKYHHFDDRSEGSI